ncbi:MAG: hypothetical protein ACOX1U_04280 [Saccharofermentanales bacterium]
MAKTGLEIIKALDTTAGEIAEIISKGHPPFEEGGSVACDLVTCEQCWLAWLTTGKPPIPPRSKTTSQPWDGAERLCSSYTESRTDDGGGYFLCSFEGGDRISES